MEFAALCLTDIIDWRYMHSLVGIFDPACELLPPWTKELYCTCALLPLYTFSLTSPPPSKLNVEVYTDSVWLCRGAKLRCRPNSAEVLHSLSDQI
jgi:hypothetical protein